MSSVVDLRQNLDAATRFLEAVNSPPETTLDSTDAMGQQASHAAIQLLRHLREHEVVPLDQLRSGDETSFLAFSEALTRLIKAGAVEDREMQDGRQAVALTADGNRLAHLIDVSQIAD